MNPLMILRDLPQQTTPRNHQNQRRDDGSNGFWVESACLPYWASVLLLEPSIILQIKFQVLKTFEIINHRLLPLCMIEMAKSWRSCTKKDGTFETTKPSQNT